MIPDSDEYDELLKPVKISANVIGMWPLQKDSGKLAVMFKRLHVIWMFFVSISLSTAVTFDLIHNLDNLDEATECALICTAFYLSTVRVLIFSTHQKDMLYVVNTMQEDWVNSSNEDRIFLREKSLLYFRIAKLFISTVAITIVTFMCVSFIEIYVLGISERILPFRGYYYFINQTESPTFEFLFVFNITAAGFCGGTIASGTSFCFIVTMHGSIKFALLRKKLEALKSDELNVISDMGNCVLQHQNAILFADTIERIVTFLALGQFVISTGLICFAGFQITSMLEDKGRLMKYSTFLNSAIFELFLFSFSGNKLIDESDAVSDSAFNSNWLGSRFSQSLQIVMMRSKVPNQITAAKFYSMSLQSFAKVLSTSFSYLTVLTAMNDE